MSAQAAPAETNRADHAPILVAGDKRKRVVLVSLLGLSGEPRETAIRVVAAALGRGETPVFVTDDPDFMPLARHGHLYEYLPSAAARAAYPRDGWEDFLARRIRLLLRKWAPRRIVAAGAPFETYLAGLREDQ